MKLKTLILSVGALSILTIPNVEALNYKYGSFTPGERVEIRNKAQNLCLDPEGDYGHKGSNVLLWSCDGQNDQLWYIQPMDFNSSYFQIRNAASGHCLDVRKLSGNKGESVGVWSCDSPYSADQLWLVKGGYIINVAQGHVLDVEGTTGSHGSNVVIWSREFKDDQIWSPKKRSY